jgi:hypothetical protein
MPALAACGGRSKDAEAVKPEDPLAAPVHVGTTSARAKYCGFIFDPARLRANFLASRAQFTSPDQMQKVEKAYDYSFERVSQTIAEERNYCSKDRVEMVRRDLNRYMAGDFAPPAKR